MNACYKVTTYSPYIHRPQKILSSVNVQQPLISNFISLAEGACWMNLRRDNLFTNFTVTFHLLQILSILHKCHIGKKWAEVDPRMPLYHVQIINSRKMHQKN